jgi:photosystem II stability/assembly factor-like uncharacterized protein
VRKIFFLVLIPFLLIAEKQKDFTIDLQSLEENKELIDYMEAQKLSFEGKITSDEFYEVADKYYRSLDNKKGSGYKPFLRAKHKYGDKNVSETQPDFNKIIQEFKVFEAKQDQKKLLNAGEWVEKGPFRSPLRFNGSPTTIGTGRLNSVEVDPNNHDIIWAGAAGGGIWKSTNKGQSWVTFEETNFASLGISDIEISESNSNIVYAASGDKNAWQSGGSDVRFYSAGIYKTVNGGNSWTVVTPFSNNSTAARNFVTDIEVNPNNPDLVFASTSNGLYRSNDGGNSWTRLLTGYYTDMKMNLGNNNIIHLSRYSQSGGQTVNEMVTFDNSNETVTSTFPVNNAGRGELALSQDDPDVVYALLTVGSVFGAILKSTNSGDNWTVTVSRNNNVNYMGLFDGTGSDFNQGQGLYDLCIEVNPNNADEVIIGGINLWRSVNGGSSFNRITSWWNFNVNPPFIHADQHELQWTEDGNIYSANDGGLYVTENNGVSWEDLNDGLHITQFYRFSSSQQDDALMIGGSQDNSTWLFSGDEWVFTGVGGDGFHCLVDQEDDRVMIASQNSGGVQGSIGTLLSLSTNRGGNFGQLIASTSVNEYSQWIAPFELDPNNTDDLYIGFNNLWKVTDYKNGITQNSITNLTNNQVSSWNTIRQIDISPINGNHIWYAIGGTCLFSSNGGQDWTNVYSGNIVITDIEASKTQANVAYLTLTGFSSGRKVIKLEGTNSENISFNLPNISAYTIVEVPSTEELYVGMDIGVYRKTKNGSVWELFSKGLTRSGISELEFQESSKLLRASTYGRGIWEVPIIDCEIERPEILANDQSEDVTLCAGDEIELRYLGDYSRVEWNTGELSRKITVNKSGEYFVTAEDDEGCFARSESIKVTFDTIPPLELNISNEVEFCEGDSVFVTVLGQFDEYEWSDGTKGRIFWVKEAGEYYLTVRDGEAVCEAVSDVFTVNTIESPDKPIITIEDEKLVVSGTSDKLTWFLNGNEIEGFNGNELIPQFNGDYYVVATNSNDCSTFSDEVSVTWFSIAEGDKRGFNVSPNPTDGLITINYSGLQSGNTRLEIINSIGQVVIQDDFFANTSSMNKNFDLDKFPSGVYYVSLWNKGIRVTEKIILK